MAAADRMTPEAGKGVILVLAVSGQRALARQKGQDLPRGDRVAGGVPIGISQEEAQEVAPVVNFAPWACRQSDVMLDCLLQRHARPSRSRAATSRSAVRLTLA